MSQAKSMEKNDPVDTSFSPQEFYRSTAIGTALVTTLNKFLASERISAGEANDILNNFDRQIQASIREHAVMRKDVVLNKAETTLANYSNLMELWKLDVDDLKIKLGSKVVSTDRARILFSLEQSTSSSVLGKRSAAQRDSDDTNTA